MNQPYLIAREGIPYVVISALLTVLGFLIHSALGIFLIIITFFMAYFFRNPKRNIPSEEGLVLSPADGVIMEVSDVYEDRYLKGKAKKVSIFLSVFNVHLNRIPIRGQVEYRAYREGQFLPAFKSHASEINEKSFVGIANEHVKIMVTQVTGFIARRIVCWVKVGDNLNQGDLFGLIKFGSCTEIFLPPEVDIKVVKGDKVVGGESIIGRLL